VELVAMPSVAIDAAATVWLTTLFGLQHASH
jgi:hypothetical protein